MKKIFIPEEMVGDYSLIVTTPATGGCYIESGLSEEYANVRLESMRAMFASRNREDMRSGEQPAITKIEVVSNEEALAKRDELREAYASRGGSSLTD